MVPIRTWRFYIDDAPENERDTLRRRVDELYAGKEMAFFLMEPTNIAFPAWKKPSAHWDIQTLDGATVAVSRDTWRFDPTPENLALLVYPIAEFEKQVKAASASHPDLHGAAENPLKPPVANADSSRALAVALGALDHEGVSIITLPPAPSSNGVASGGQ